MNEIMKLEDLHEAYFDFAQSDSYLTFAQAWDAKDYMKRYLPRIFMLIKDLDEGFPPELQDIKNNPAGWEAKHWFWFVNKYIKR